MARFNGVVGFGTSVETPADSGNWIDQIVEKTYFGDVIRNTRKLDSDEDLNDDISVNNSISIVADPYANENFLAIKFVEWVGMFWTVTNVEVRYPRLLLTLGKVYNGERA